MESNNTTKTKPASLFEFTFSGSQWILKNINFFLFLSFLAIVYIANGHMADKTIRNINKLQAELEQLKYEYKTLKSEVMFTSEEMQVKKAVEPLGLKISNEVPLRIAVK